MIRQELPDIVIALVCPENNITQASRGGEQVFTMVVYGMLFIGRFLEALIIEIHIYKFLFGKSTFGVYKFKEMFIEELKRRRWIAWLVFIMTTYMSIHSLSIPALGIALEIQHGTGVNCDAYVYEHHVVYWMPDVIRYIYDISIRVFLMLATIVVNKIWLYDEEESDSHTKEPETYSEYLQDRAVTNEDHKSRTDDYIGRGGKVEVISEIFQTWFIIPWVLFFIGSSLETDYILKSWTDKTKNGKYSFPEVVYLIYNLNQLVLLTLPYICAKIMHTRHHKYFTKLRQKQLLKYKTASRMAFARIQKIEKEVHFDFTPRIWGTSIKISIDDPFYVILLLLGIFFTTCDGLI